MSSRASHKKYLWMQELSLHKLFARPHRGVSALLASGRFVCLVVYSFFFSNAVEIRRFVK